MINDIQERILAEIIEERLNHPAMSYDGLHDSDHSLNDWVAITTRHLGCAASDGGEEDPERFRRQFIRVGSLVLAALEAMEYAKRRTAEPTKSAGRPADPEKRWG